ncbi:MAG: response regulator [Sphingomonadaceae bacterium]|nr:response regulator [Sphingomonadaceae bacterium]
MLGKKPKRRINRILIVEDEPLVAFDNEHVLRDAGYEVVGSVDRVEDAIALIRADGIDLVLADVSLAEGESGIDVARAAKARGVALLFVAGSCPVEARKLAIGCLAKPYLPRELTGAIEAVEAVLVGKKPKKPPAGLSLYSGEA